MRNFNGKVEVLKRWGGGKRVHQRPNDAYLCDCVRTSTKGQLSGCSLV